MAETISGELPAWLVQKTFLNSNAVSQELQAGLQYAQQQKQLAQHQQALALQQQAFQLKQEADLHVSQGLVDLGNVVSEIAQSGDWTSPENRAKFYDTAAKHPEMMKTPVFRSLEDNFQMADRAKEAKELWQTKLANRAETKIVEVDGAKFLQNLATGALHPVPKDYSEGAAAVPIYDDEGNVLGYGLQNSRGGITPLRQPHVSATMDPVKKAAMNAEFAELKRWRETAKSSGGWFGKKVDVDAEYNQRLKAIVEKYGVKPKEHPAPAAPETPKVGITKEEFDALPSGSVFTAPDGTRRVKP